MAFVVLLVSGGAFSAQAAGPTTTKEYTDLCEKELGERIPEIQCDKGVEIPITFTPVGGPTKIVKKVGDLDDKLNCDKPFLIGLGAANVPETGKSTSCVPFSRIRMSRQSDVQFVFICRANFFRDPTAVRFDDLGLIAHNTKTGATCFWSVPINERPPGYKGRCEPSILSVAEGSCTTGAFGVNCGCNVDGDCASMNCVEQPDLSFPADTKIPKPGSDGDLNFWRDGRAKKNFWKTLDGNEGLAKTGRCMYCHDSDPFIHTPVVRQNTVEAMVPRDPTGRYFAVAVDTLKALATDPTVWTPAQVLDDLSLIGQNAADCLGCHRIGDRATCEDFVPDAVGDKKLTTTNARYADVYPFKMWMDKFDALKLPKTEEAWEEKFGLAAATISRCCTLKGSKSGSKKCWKAMPGS
jgi:hypothetical protein